MKNQTATAMALALVAGVVGLAAVPAALADGQCDGSNFSIADSELSASVRTLGGDSSEVGLEDVVMNSDEILHVKLLSLNDELRFTIYVLDGGTCVEDPDSDCTFPVVLDELNEEATCTLDSPSSRDFWVEFVNAQSDGLLYKPWAAAS